MTRLVRTFGIAALAFVAGAGATWVLTRPVPPVPAAGSEIAAACVPGTCG